MKSRHISGRKFHRLRLRVIVSSALISEKLMGRPWDIVEYGVCCVEDMLAEIPETTVTVRLFYNLARAYDDSGRVLDFGLKGR